MRSSCITTMPFLIDVASSGAMGSAGRDANAWQSGPNVCFGSEADMVPDPIYPYRSTTHAWDERQF